MTSRVRICGLGPGGTGHLTTETADALTSGGRIVLRTSRHPSAYLAGDAESFDHLYEQADTFADVYREIVERLVQLGADDLVTYVVPGSPLVLEESVRLLLADDRVEAEVLPGLSFLDLAWARLGVDPVDAGVRLVDGHRFSVEAAGERGPLLVAHTHAPWVLSDIKLASEPDGEQPVTVLQGLGTEHERVFEVGWDDLDRVVEPDHLTSLFITEMAAPVAGELAASVALMSRLRRECPWDQEQDHHTLRRYLLEETHEVLEAIDALPVSAPHSDGLPESPSDSEAVDEATMAAYSDLEEELGDLWFQILFHAELASEAGQFTVADVARTLHEKLVRRHPHVFGDVEVDGSDEIVANWDRIKQEEKDRSSALDGIPAGLPALALAAKTLQRARRSGVESDPASLLPEEDPWLRPDVDADELGRLLFGIVAWASEQGLDAEDALRGAVVGARRRFIAEEAQAGPDGVAPDWVRG